MENNDHQKQLKEKIIKYYSQAKTGCYRDICYNKNCRKSRSSSLLKIELFFSNEKEILTYAFTLAKQGAEFCDDFNEGKPFKKYDPNLGNVDESMYFESLALNFVPTDLKKIDCINSLFDIGLGFDYGVMKAFFIDYKKKYSKPEEIKGINTYLSSKSVQTLFERKDEDSTIIKSYFIFLLSRLLVYASVHPYLGFEDLNSNAEFDKFFGHYLKLMKHMKEENSFVRRIYKGLSKELFVDILNSYQSFVTLFFMLPVTKTSLQKLKNLIKVFDIFHSINNNENIVPYTEFYNETLNSNEEIKYFILKNHFKKKLEKRTFDLVKYPWLFDSAFKRDILASKNIQKQRQEMFNSLNSGSGLGFFSIDNILNLDNSIHLPFSIRRDNIIEDTLNIISDSQLNFQKPLKVY